MSNQPSYQLPVLSLLSVLVFEVNESFARVGASALVLQSSTPGKATCLLERTSQRYQRRGQGQPSNYETLFIQTHSFHTIVLNMLLKH